MSTIAYKAKGWKPKPPIIIPNTMKYIVRKGSKLFDQLAEIHSCIQVIDKSVKDLIIQLGGDGNALIRNGAVAGDLTGICFREKPAGWKQVEVRVSHNAFWPKALKENRKIFDQLKAINSVKRDELNAIVGFKKQWSGVALLAGIGVRWGDDYHLVHIPEEAEYTPLAGMTELLESEYKRLQAELETAGEEVAGQLVDKPAVV